MGVSSLRTDGAPDMPAISPKTSHNPIMRLNQKNDLYICLEHTKYEVVRKAADNCGYTEVSNLDGTGMSCNNKKDAYCSTWNILWSDASGLNEDRAGTMKIYQKLNHFPSMGEISRKDCLARNLGRMQKLFPEDFSFFPKTWILPLDHSVLSMYVRSKKNMTFILKPDVGSMGKGIWLTKKIEEITPDMDCICQRYISNPLLIDDFKFDMRIYVLVSSVDPLRIYTYREGLARLATNKYCKPKNNNLDNEFMHLTNYSINRSSPDFIFDSKSGSKRRLSDVLKEISVTRNCEYQKLWDSIDECIVKTILSVYNSLHHSYKAYFPTPSPVGSNCFEILGFDMIFDDNLNLFLLEVNSSPSLSTDSDLDEQIKGSMVEDCLTMVSYGFSKTLDILEKDKKRIRLRLLNRSNKNSEEFKKIDSNQINNDISKFEEENCGNFARCFPARTETKKSYYSQFMDSMANVFKETIAYKARHRCALLLREKLQKNVDSNTRTINSFVNKALGLYSQNNGEEGPISSDNINTNNNSKSMKIKKKQQYFIKKNKLAIREFSIFAKIMRINPRYTRESLVSYPSLFQEEQRLNLMLNQREHCMENMGIIEEIKKSLRSSKNSEVEDDKTLNLLKNNLDCAIETCGTERRLKTTNNMKKMSHNMKSLSNDYSELQELTKRINIHTNDNVILTTLDSNISSQRNLCEGSSCDRNVNDHHNETKSQRKLFYQK